MKYGGERFGSLKKVAEVGETSRMLSCFFQPAESPSQLPPASKPAMSLGLPTANCRFLARMALPRRHPQRLEAGGSQSNCSHGYPRTLSDKPLLRIRRRSEAAWSSRYFNIVF